NDFLEIHYVAAAVHLPEAGDTGLGVESPEVMVLVRFQIRLEEGARADQRHVADEHVPALRQFVYAPAPEPGAEVSHAWVVRNLEQARIARQVEMGEIFLLVIGTDAHRPELEHPEALSAQARAILPEEDRPWGIQPDHECDGGHDRCEYNHGEHRPDHIDCPLHDQRLRFEQRRAKLEKRLVLVPDEQWPPAGDLYRSCGIQELASRR